MYTQGVTVHNKFLRIQMYYFYVCVTQSSKYTRRICTLCIYIEKFPSTQKPVSLLCLLYVRLQKGFTRACLIYTYSTIAYVHFTTIHIHLYKTETQRRVSIIYV